MNRPDEIDENLARAYGGRRESDAEGLARAGLAGSGEAGDARGSVAGSGRARAAAGITSKPVEKADLERWVLRLGGLEPEAELEDLEEGASLAITYLAEMTATIASGERDSVLESLQDCVESFALDLVRRRTAPALEPQRAAGLSLPRPGYDDLEATARLRDLAQRRVEELRRDLFDSTPVPFATLDEAVAWIEAEQAKAGEHSPEEIAAFLAAYRQIDVQFAQLFYGGSPFEDDSTYPTERLLQLRPGSKVRRFAVGRSGTLMQLYYGLQGLARDLHVYDWEAADFVLFGVPPMVPRYSIIRRQRSVAVTDSPPREWVRVAWIELEINDRFFSYEDIREVYRDLAASGFFMSKKSPAQLAKLRRLWEFVNERRPRERWREGAARRPLSWKLVRREWNAANPEETYCLSGIQKAYKEADDYLAGRATSTSRRRGRRPEAEPPTRSAGPE
jgi:hypothetical protein